jgi:hypothetical protein
MMLKEKSVKRMLKKATLWISNSADLKNATRMHILCMSHCTQSAIS